jgi:hypothetical protein
MCGCSIGPLCEDLGIGSVITNLDWSASLLTSVCIHSELSDCVVATSEGA